MQLLFARRAVSRASLSRTMPRAFSLSIVGHVRASALMLLVMACGGGDGGGGPKATALRVDPATLTIDIGETLQLTASAVDGQGSVVVNSNPNIIWRSLAPTIATVDEGGLVTAVTAGTASIEAKAGSLVGTASVTVNRPAVGRVEIDPASLSLFRGGTGQLSAKVFSDRGSEVNDRTVSWTSLNESVASVTATGLTATVTAKAPGSVEIRATSEGISTEVTIFVGADPIIVLSAPSLDLTLARLAALPVEGTVQISNGAAGTLTGLTSSTSYASGEATGWLAASLSSTAQPSTLTLRASAGTLGEGTYHATVTVSSSLPSVDAKTVAVKLSVGPGPTIALSSAAVSLATFAGAPPPSSTSVTVSNGGGATLSGIALGTVTWSGTANWATFTLSGTTAPASLTIAPAAAISSLAAGTYSATVPVTTTLPSVASTNVIVTLTVGAAPVITLSPPNVSFTAAAGGSPPATQQVSIGNSGGGTLSGVATGAITYGSAGSGWLTATLQNGASASPTVVLAANNAGLAIGTYTAVVPVTSSNSFVAAKQIDVTLNVGAVQVIAVATPSVSVVSTQGGANPTPVNVAITNGGTGTLSGLLLDPVTFTGGPTGWMTAAIASGTAPTTVTLSFATGALAVGNYTAKVPIRSTIAGVIPATITVALSVRSGATIALSSASVTIQGLSGGSNPPATFVNVSNGAIGTLTGLSLGSVSYGNGQPAGWLSPTISGTAAPATVTLAASVAGLSAGSYTAIVPVESNLSGVTPVSIAVTLVVNPATTMAVSSLNVTMNAPNGGGNPAAANLTVTNTGPNALSGLSTSVTYTGSPPTNWLTSSVSPTTAPATLTLTANVALLPSGTYHAQVLVASVVATNSPQTVQVTLVVPPPAIAISSSSVSATATQSVGVATSGFGSIQITNSGGGILQGVRVDSVHYLSGSGWITTSVSPTRAPSTLTISVNTATASTMARGTYTATIWVNATGATNSPRVINATLNLVYTYNTHVASLWGALPGTVTKSCASSGCHDNNAVANGAKFSLSAGDVYATLTTMTGTGGVRLVLPNSPSNSLLYQRTSAGTMPSSFYGSSSLYAQRILGWINDGARRQ